MAYRGIDKKRFSYLLSYGADDFELKKFFSDCRIQLIQNGGRVQNLPQGSKARIQMLAAGLPPTTDDVVQAWFAKHISMVDPEEVEEVVRVFKRYEEVDDELPEDSARRFARSCLVHLFSKEPPQSLLNYLNTPIDVQTEEQDLIAEVAGDERDVPHDNVYPENLPQVLVDLVEKNDADEHLVGFPPELATFINGLQSAEQGQTKQATEAAGALLANSILRNRLEQYIGQQETRKAASEPSSRGLRIMDPEMFEGTFEYERDEVFAYCTKADNPKAVFVHPIAVVRNARIQLLSDEKRRALFPENGDVMGFAGAGHPRQLGRSKLVGR